MNRNFESFQLTEPEASAINNFVAFAGDKWTLLILRDALFFGKHEFNEFLSSPEAIATNILTSRLNNLVANGILAKMKHPTHRSKKLYYLLPKGKSMLPVFLQMIYWEESAADMRTEERRKNLNKSVVVALESWESEFLEDKIRSVRRCI